MVKPLLKTWKGSGIVEGLLSREWIHFLGWGKLWGMKGCDVGTIVGVGT
jgi:hypothetical protein